LLHDLTTSSAFWNSWPSVSAMVLGGFWKKLDLSYFPALQKMRCHTNQFKQNEIGRRAWYRFAVVPALTALLALRCLTLNTPSLHSHRASSIPFLSSRIMSAASRIEYSEKYADEHHEYRYVVVTVRTRRFDRRAMLDARCSPLTCCLPVT
jgi:Cyclin-dependent kinase regulatory subunit